MKDLQVIKRESSLDFIMLSVVDILNEKNISIISDEADALVIKEVFGADVSDGLVDL
jgi:inorganic pyrophosphatase/exopolyphosphatase